MSFAAKVKEELSREVSNSAHCRIAELSAIIGMCGRIIIDENDHISLKIQTENVTVLRKYFTLLKKTFNINGDLKNRQMQSICRSRVYVLTVSDDSDARKLLTACRLIGPSGEIIEDLSEADAVLLKKECCRRAFIRGAFLAGGSVNDPVKSYHFEIVCASEDRALQLQSTMETFGIQAKIITRKRHYVVYVKDSSQVVDLLNIMGAHNALMDMENIRIVKEMRNTVNRKVNCETANINKTVNAAVKQMEDIQFIFDCGAFGRMSEQLQEMAIIRRENPSASLAELGGYMDPPLGKAGVNHRLKKISQFAEKLRSGN